MSRRRALMGQKDSNVLWEWTPEKGLSNIGFTASGGDTPSYELLSDCLRLKAPNPNSIHQTRLTIPNPPATTGTVEIEAHIKNFPINGYNSKPVSIYLCAYSFLQKATYCRLQGDLSVSLKKSFIGGAQKTEEQYTGNETSFVLKLRIDASANTATAYFPNGHTMTTTNGDAITSKTAISIEGHANAYFDVTKIVIRRVTE